MTIRKRDKREAERLFRACFQGPALDESRLHQIVQVAITVHPRNMPPVLQHLLRLVRLNRACHTATVESAVQLTPENQVGVQNHLVRRYGSDLSFSFVEKPSLIGGVRVQVGHDVYDGSIRGALLRMEQRL